MKHLLALTIVFLFSLAGFAQGEKQIASRKIRSVCTSVTETKKGKESTKTICTTYSKKSLPLTIETSGAQGEKISTETFTYKRNGDILVHSFTDYQNPEKSFREITDYDQLGKDTLLTVFDGQEKLKYKVRSFYDRGGKKTREVHSDENDLLIKTTEYVYDNRDMLLEKTTRDKDGVIIYRKTNTYIY